MPIYMPKTKVRYYFINEILTIKEYWNLIGQKQIFPKSTVFQNVNEP